MFVAWGLKVMLMDLVVEVEVEGLSGGGGGGGGGGGIEAIEHWTVARAVAMDPSYVQVSERDDLLEVHSRKVCGATIPPEVPNVETL